MRGQPPGSVVYREGEDVVTDVVSRPGPPSLRIDHPRACIRKS